MKNTRIFYIVFIILILVSFIFLFFPNLFSNKNEKEGFIERNPETGEFDIEEIQKRAVIPLDIYQTWHTKDLPPKMRECVEKLKKANPEFTHHLYDENDCREFIKNNFDSDVLEAFDGLIPLSYKSDLWRFCVLYKNGGIYLDIKFEPVGDFKFIELVDKEYFVLDKPYGYSIKVKDELELINSNNYYENIYNNIDKNLWKNKEIGLYTALIICNPNNPILFNCIQQIVKNVKNKFYGHNSLYPTGPGLLGEKYFNGDMSKIKRLNLFFSLNGGYILSKKKKILNTYSNYYGKEHEIYAKIKHYQELWKEKQIYK